MTSLGAKSRKDRLLRVFQRTGGAGAETRPFDALPKYVQQQLIRDSDVVHNELPILASYRSDRCWLLLTSERLITNFPAWRARIPWPEIVDATIVPDDARKALSRSAEGKLSLQRIRIILSSSEVHDIEVESGPPFVALWNVLKTVAALRG